MAVRLHYVERGSGSPLVLFHGNGSMIQDFESSGPIELSSKRYRTIVFGRPGFGHSSRPGDVVWTPAVQADLFRKALERLGAERAIFLALPGLGDILSYTVSPIVGRMMWPAMLRKMFGPSQVPEKFASFP
jgi:pimeloyl-ACP methyl ester carboxylesterase